MTLSGEKVTCATCEGVYDQSLPSCPHCLATNPRMKKKSAAGKAVYLVILVIALAGALAFIAFIRPALNPPNPHPAAFIPDHVANLTVSGLPANKEYVVSFRVLDKYSQDIPTDGIAKFEITDDQGSVLYDNTFTVKQADFAQQGKGQWVSWHIRTMDVKSGTGNGTADMQFTPDGGGVLPSAPAGVTILQSSASPGQSSGT